MDSILTYHTARTQIHRDPDGTLHIDIPPKGWRGVFGHRSNLSLIPGLVFVCIGLIGPPAMIYFFRSDNPAWLGMFFACVILEPVALLIIGSIIWVSASRSTHITATPHQLTFETFGTPSPSTFRVSRDEIEWLAANTDPSTFEHFLLVRRKRHDTSDSLLGGMPLPEIQDIATLLQDQLQLDPTARQVPPSAQSRWSN
jgi:hypothetical protein